MKIYFEETITPDYTKTPNLFEALALTYRENHAIDVEALASLTSLSKDQVIEYLEPYLFLDPEAFDKTHDITQHLILKEDYERGNLEEKYLKANHFNQKYGGFFQKNVTFLENKKHPIPYQNIFDISDLWGDDIINQALGPTKNNRDRALRLRHPKMCLLLNLLELHSRIFEHPNKELEDMTNYVINNLIKTETFKQQRGYLNISFEKDPFFQLLLQKESVIIETNPQQRLYLMLLGAKLLIDYHLEKEVTLIVGNTMKYLLLELKNQYYSTYPITIVTGRISKQNGCVFIDESVSSLKRVLKNVSGCHVTCFLSCLPYDTFLLLNSSIFHCYEIQKYIKTPYIYGYMATSSALDKSCFVHHQLHNPQIVFHQLAANLSIHPSSWDYQLEMIHEDMSEVDKSLCQLEEKDEVIEKLRAHFVAEEKLLGVSETVFLLSETHPKQLIYIDDASLMEQFKVDLMNLGVSINDIQVIKSAGKIKEASYYIAKTKSVYPFQIEGLSAIHHLTIPSSLTSWYQRYGSQTHYIYFIQESMDSYHLQELYHQHLFYNQFLQTPSFSTMLYEAFYQSSTCEEVHQLLERRREFIDFLHENQFHFPKQEKPKVEPVGKYRFTRHQKQLLYETLNQNLEKTYFNHKKRYLCTIGNYDLYLPEDMIENYSYVLLINQNQRYYLPINKGEDYLPYIIHHINKGEIYEQYDTNEC